MNKRTELSRLLILVFLLFVLFFLFLYRSTSIMFIDNDYYMNLVTESSTVNQTIIAPRGEIVDRNGRTFTSNQTQYNLIIDKSRVSNDSLNALILSLASYCDSFDIPWLDILPISMEEPFTITDSDEAHDICNDLDLNDNVSGYRLLHELVNRYELQSYSSKEKRILASVLYQMDLRDFSYTNPYTFATDVGSTFSSAVLENSYNLIGSDIVNVAAREYVDGYLAPHIVGTTGLINSDEWAALRNESKTFYDDSILGYRYNDQIGKTGIEYACEDFLRGQNGVKQISFDNAGNVLSSSISQEAVAGNNVVLTIDKDLQQAAYNSLASKIKLMNENYEVNKGKEADAGCVVAVSVKSGEILAMVNYPTFDISTYYEDYEQLASDTTAPLFNRATMGTYTIGSTYKPMVAIAGLATGTISENEKINCTGKYTFYDDYQPSCEGVHSWINVKDALRVSCNLFFYDVGRRLGIDQINRYASMFGLGQKTGIEIPEVSGQLSSPKTREAVGDEWGPGYVLQSAIGQLDNAFTPIQMAGYVQTLANNGERLQLHLIKSITSYDYSETIRETPVTVIEQVDAPESAFEVVREGMIRASYGANDATGYHGTSYGTWGVERGSTWLSTYGEEILVASKTGSPQTGSEIVNSFFICYAPADDPEIAVVVCIEKGYEGYTGASVARDVLTEYFFGSEDEDSLTVPGSLIG